MTAEEYLKQFTPEQLLKAFVIRHPNRTDEQPSNEELLGPDGWRHIAPIWMENFEQQDMIKLWKIQEQGGFKADQIDPDQLANLVAVANATGAEEIIAFRQTFQTFLGYKLPGDEEYGPGHQINLSGGASILLVIRFPFADEGPPGIERLK